MAIGVPFYIKSNPGNVTVSRFNPCTLYEVDAQNLNGADLWLMVFDTAALPSPGDVPIYSYRVSNGATIAIAPPAGPGLQGRNIALGLFVTWCSAPVYVVDAGPFGNSLIFVAGRDHT